MDSLALVDRIEIQVVVDNATDSLSTIPAHRVGVRLSGAARDAGIIR